MSNTENMLKGRVTIGDWSGDGHSQTEVIDILIPKGLTAKSPGWDQSAYIKGDSRKTWGCSDSPDLWFYYHLALSKGVPDLKTFCEEYEESTVSKERFDELVSSLGKNPEDYELDVDNDLDEEPQVWLDSEIFADLWVDIVNYGIKLNGEVGEIKTFREVKEKVLNYNIGGYGLLGG